MSDYLPHEVIEQILSRVPVQSLVRFRCVCKSWRSLISSPRFITDTANNGQKLLLFRYFSRITKRDEYIFRLDNATFDAYAAIPSCPFKSRLLYFRLVGTCNGLLCLCDNPYRGYGTVILWNPAIGKFVKLPRPSIELPMAALGFGFDSQSLDFKVVRLSCKRERGIATAPMVEIFSVRSGSWRTIRNGWDPSYGIVESLWSQVFLNGSVHWVGYKSADRRPKYGSFLVASFDSADKYFRLQEYMSTPEDGFCNAILTLDLADEEFRMIEIPQVVAGMFPLNFSLGLYGDSLALFVYDIRLNCQVFDIFVMKEYGVAESWSRLFSIKAKEGIWAVFGFTSGGDVLLAANKKIHSYSPGNGYKILGNPGAKRSIYAGSFVETLALLDEVNEGLSDVVAASEADAEKEEKETEFLHGRSMWYYLSIAASLIGVHLSG